MAEPAPKWVWDPLSKAYRNLRSGQYMSNKQALGFVRQSLGATQGVVDRLAQLAGEAKVSPADFGKLMRAEVKKEYIRDYVFGRGGLSQMTQADWGRVGHQLRDQYGFLNGFVQDIRDGKASAGQITVRARMYIGSGRQAYERAQRQNATELGQDEESWFLDEQKEHCEDCPRFAEMGWQPIGTFPEPGDGTTQCLTNCGCHKEYRKAGAERERGGSGSGNFEHEGRPGLQGGSVDSGGGASDFEVSDSDVEESYSRLYSSQETAIDGLSEETSGAILSYTDGGHRDINENLRENKGEYTDYAEDIGQIETAMDAAGKTEEEAYLCRGMMVSPERLRDLEPGKEFVDYGYVSTTGSAETAQKFLDADVIETEGKVPVLVTMYVPKGARALCVGQNSRYPDELEVVLGAGSKFQVTSSEESESGTRNVHMVLVAQTGVQKAKRTLRSWPRARSGQMNWDRYIWIDEQRD